jgi:FtsP/CotA-like multicopper oxidase with cupredoxin domain
MFGSDCLKSPQATVFFGVFKSKGRQGMISRREFVKIGAAVGAGVMLPAGMVGVAEAFNPSTQPAPANPLRLTKYIDNLPIMGLMPTAAPNYYRVGAYQFKVKAHSQMLPTTAWGYRPLGFVPSLTRPENTWLSPTFAIARGTRTKVEWQNKLNGVKHPLPVDPSIMVADPLHNLPPMGTVYPVDSNGISTFNYSMNTVPIITHVHGGEQPPGSDGGPFGWFTPGFAKTGPEWANSGDVQANFTPTGKHNVYPYYNSQLPATIWFHDHALGLDRLNVYMGMAGAYVIYDTALEPGFSTTVAGSGVPSILDTVLHPTYHDRYGQPFDIPLVIQDRIFDSKGQLWYPGSGDNPTIHPFWVPEFFGDTICVNGKVWPNLKVEPRKYRFRVLDGSNARFYNLMLQVQNTLANGPGFQVIAGDDGYLTAPATYAPGSRMLIAPGERHEIVIDFSTFAGQNLLLTNDAVAPFAGGDPVNPNTTAQIMRFQVDATVSFPDTNVVPAALNPVLGTTFPSITTAPVITRQLTLNEIQGDLGPTAVTIQHTALDLPTTETPRLGTTEIWRIVNMTADTHPMHVHLVGFQLKSRQDFRHQLDTTAVDYAASYDAAWAAAYPGGLVPADASGPPMAYNLPGTTLADGSTLMGGSPDVTPFLVSGTLTPAEPQEQGWKDTIKIASGTVAELIVRFAPNDNTPSFPFDATAPLGYVWHCHILEHEENDMMRRYTVQP